MTPTPRIDKLANEGIRFNNYNALNEGAILPLAVRDELSTIHSEPDLSVLAAAAGRTLSA